MMIQAELVILKQKFIFIFSTITSYILVIIRGRTRFFQYHYYTNVLKSYFQNMYSLVQFNSIPRFAIGARSIVKIKSTLFILRVEKNVKNQKRQKNSSQVFLSIATSKYFVRGYNRLVYMFCTFVLCINTSFESFKKPLLE